MATWSLTVLGLVLAATGLGALGLVAAGGVLELPQVAVAGHLSARFLRRVQPPEIVAVAAGAALVALSCALVSVVVQQVRALRSAAGTARQLPGSGLVSVIEDDAVVDAFALPGRPGRVVVSTGMLAALDEVERAALLGHEKAHLEYGHHLFRSAVRVATAANPLLWPLRSAVDFATERWADERAASVVRDRRRTAHAIAKAAVARRARAGCGSVSAAALGFGPRSAERVGPVPRRVQALLRPPPGRRPGLLIAVASLAVIAVTAVQEQALDLHEIVEISRIQHRHTRRGPEPAHRRSILAAWPAPGPHRHGLWLERLPRR